MLMRTGVMAVSAAVAAMMFGCSPQPTSPVAMVKDKIYSVTPDGEFLLANPALRKMLGYASEEELAQGNLEVDHVRRQEHLVFRHALEERGEVRGFESMWRRRDGTSVHVSLNATPSREAMPDTSWV